MLSLEEAVKYVGGAYAVFLALVVVYVAIIAVRMDRMRRELSELADLADRRRAHDSGPTAGEAVEEKPRAGVS